MRNTKNESFLLCQVTNDQTNCAIRLQDCNLQHYLCDKEVFVAKSQIYKIAKSVLWMLLSNRIFQRVSWALYKEHDAYNTYRIEQILRSKTGGKLGVGPFPSLIYPEFNHKGMLSLATKYLGTFEKEIHPLIEQIRTEKYQTVLNIGSADGYYTVGFSLMFPTATAIAWEMDSEFQKITLEVSRANNIIDRLDLRGYCDANELKSVQSSGPTLIFCDCEGGEDTLLTQDNLIGKGKVDVIVECHEMFVPGITQTLIDRFSSTHQITRIGTTARTLADIPKEILEMLPGSKHEILRTFEEPRLYNMDWLLLKSL